MEESEVKLVIEEINNFIQNELWFDFSVQQYTNDKLIITGGLSRSYPPMIEFILMRFLSYFIQIGIRIHQKQS